jgi:hypothetical protein
LGYERITLRPTAEGCTGSATGTYLGVSGDVLFDIPFTAELAGVIDRTGPSLTPIPAGKTELHPLDPRGVAAGEILPAGTSARWVSSDGAALPMTALPRANAIGVSGFLIESRALDFASSYQLEVAPAAVDLAGNLTAPPVLKTMAGPGLFAQDGFEGPVAALLGGKVSVVDGTSGPIPTGSKAIRFTPTGWAGGEWSCDDRFTARLAVAPGAKTVKLTALAFRSWYSGPFLGWLRLAVPNGPVADLGSYWVTKGTPLPGWDAGPVPDAGAQTYSGLVQLAFDLPDGTGSEIIFDLYRQCTEPMLSGDGLVLDDLRVE